MAWWSNQPPRASEAGTVAVEYGLILPALIALFLGSMDVSRLIWTYTTLHRAVEAAARYGAVLGTSDTAAIQTEGVNQAWGLATSPSVFTVDTGDTAITVTANYDFVVLVPFLGDALTQGVHRITVSARYPKKAP